MSAQVDHDLLADYVGGALDGTPEADRVASLIAESPRWREAADALSAAVEAVSHDLAILRATPEPMPPDIVARFGELLQSPAVAPVKARPAVDPLAARQPTRKVRGVRRWRRMAVPAGLLAAFFGFLGVLNFFSLEGSKFETPAGAPQQDAGATNSLAFTSAPAVATITSGRHHNRTSVSASRMSSLPVAPPETLKHESTPTHGSGVGVTGIIPPELERLTEPTALRQCLEAIANVLPGTPTLIDFAYFEGHPALVISITAGMAKWTFVAGPGCGIKGPDEIFRTPLQ